MSRGVRLRPLVHCAPRHSAGPEYLQRAAYQEEPMEPYVLVTLLAAALQAFSSVYVKRLHSHTDNPLKVGFYTLFGCAALTLLLTPFIELRHTWRAPEILLTMCAAVAGGHIAFIAAMRVGEASFVVPMMGIKMFFVAGFAALILGETYNPLVYVAAIGVFAGMFFLNDGSLRAPPLALLLIMLTMSLFGLTDVLLIKLLRAGYSLIEVQVYMFVIPSILLLPVAAVLLRNDWRIKPDFFGSLSIYGVIQMAGGLCLMWAFSLSYKATMVNIVQSARGLFAIGVVYLIGRSGMRGFEQLNRRQYQSRLFGAALMTASIALAVSAN